MKTILRLTFILLLSAVLTSCEGRGGKSLSQMSDMTAADSLLYYFGQMRVHEYMQNANADTTLLSLESRRRFMDGVRDGYNMLKADDPVYNLGVRAGARMARKALTFEDEYYVTLNKEVLFESMEYALLHADSLDALEAQKHFYAMLRKLNANREKQDRYNASHTLKGIAEKQKMKEIKPNLYEKVVKESHGAQIRKGSVINAGVNYYKSNGEDLGMPTPEELVVGSPEMPAIVTEMYCAMKVGEKAIFATSAFDVFGHRMQSDRSGTG